MIQLYHTESCPYCVKVRRVLEAEGIEYESKLMASWGNDPIRDELRSLGGKTQVPFLVDPERGVKMYESDDIISYVKEHYAPRTR